MEMYNHDENSPVRIPLPAEIGRLIMIEKRARELYDSTTVPAKAQFVADFRQKVTHAIVPIELIAQLRDALAR